MPIYIKLNNPNNPNTSGIFFRYWELNLNQSFVFLTGTFNQSKGEIKYNEAIDLENGMHYFRVFFVYDFEKKTFFPNMSNISEWYLEMIYDMK